MHDNFFAGRVEAERLSTVRVTASICSWDLASGRGVNVDLAPCTIDAKDCRLVTMATRDSSRLWI